MVVRVNLRNLQPFSSVQYITGANIIYPDVKALYAIPNTDAYLLSARPSLTTNSLLIVVHTSTCSEYNLHVLANM